MSRDGLRMDPKKISAIRDLDPTQINTLEKIRSFLGLVSYYRRFVAGFSKLAVPLHNLTKDGVDVPTASQTPECQDAIKALINSITSEPVLCTPRFDRPFILKTDAANTEGLGGVLSQHDDEGRERVIGYYGRRLNPHERNYTITEIELLAAVESIKHWRPYLWGREFKLIVDHSALRWLHTMKDTMEGGPASRLMRWILKLAEYNFTVEHKPGVLHKDADGVSRLAAPVLHQRLATLWGDDDPYDHVAAATPGTRGTHQRRRVTTARSLQREARQTLSRSEVTAQFLDTGAPSRQTLVDEQWKDPDCRALIDYINRVGNPDPADADAMRHAVRMHRRVFGKERETGLQLKRRLDVTADGTLIKITPAGARLYVPASLQDALMYAHHDRLGHHSAERTSAALKTTYYWPGLDAAVRDSVNECHHCTLSKPHKTVPRQPTGSTLGHYPFDVVYADILDMAYTANYVKRSKSDAATSAAAQTPAGHRKLIVFVDSLSRWVEAIPLYSDPTSEQVLDIFMEHVVSRHGTPRRVVTDCGSNLASRICHEIHEKTGTNLTPTAAEHHEGVGVVERFNQTIANMMRSTDEGGRHWSWYLPFLLMSYRATPHRVTKLSPSVLLYGRELRLPAQIASGEPASNATSLQTGSDNPTRRYAQDLHKRLWYAWQSARQLSLEQQAEHIAETTRKAGHVTEFAVGDTVVRRLHGLANKLEYTYAGPYRVHEKLPNGRYRLRDLENKHIEEDFDISNLRKYHTPDCDQLDLDEYIIDALLDRRKVRGHYSYLVKWRGYPTSAATWEPVDELRRRAEEMVEEYDERHPRPSDSRSRRAPATASPASSQAELPSQPTEGRASPATDTDSTPSAQNVDKEPADGQTDASAQTDHAEKNAPPPQQQQQDGGKMPSSPAPMYKQRILRAAAANRMRVLEGVHERLIDSPGVAIAPVWQLPGSPVAAAAKRRRSSGPRTPSRLAAGV